MNITYAQNTTKTSTQTVAREEKREKQAVDQKNLAFSQKPSLLTLQRDSISTVVCCMNWSVNWRARKPTNQHASRVTLLRRSAICVGRDTSHTLRNSWWKSECLAAPPNTRQASLFMLRTRVSHGCFSIEMQSNSNTEMQKVSEMKGNCMV